MKLNADLLAMLERVTDQLSMFVPRNYEYPPCIADARALIATVKGE